MRYAKQAVMLAGFLVLSLNTTPLYAKKSSSKEKVSALIPTLKKQLQHPKVVDAILASNKVCDQKGNEKALDEIKTFDKKWINSVGTPSFIRPYLTNPCALYLKALKKKKTYTAEIFVMNKLGAIVCETDKTSDFYQGDEDKWQKAFNDGKGADFVAEPSFDESTQAFLIQVSVPIRSKGAVIGTATIGIDLDKIK